MNKKLSLAVASAVMAAATSANAGIMIPAGDWTLDIGGIVNAYYTHTSFSGDAVFLNPGSDIQSSSNITTGLLPNYLSVSGKTRQNDLDVGFTISIQPGASTNNAGIQNTPNNQENRQAFLTFGDKSWGSIKLGKDLGIYASDAILNDMTLLGVGSGAGVLSGNTTTLGRIGNGFIYADWKAQVAYTSPNWNGFSFTAGVTQGWNALAGFGGVGTSGRAGSSPAFEGKASYEWAGDVGGKVWASFLSQKLEFTALDNSSDETARAWDLGATVNVAGFGLTGYYYDGKALGTLVQFLGALDASGNDRDSDGYYVQATYTLPGVGTKLGVSYGRSELEANDAASEGLLGLSDDFETDMWTVGAYHPLTKHLNLVAEYSSVEEEIGSTDGKAKTISLGAILFF
ncbi:MAG: porin [Methylophilaceae bacterium]